MTVSIRPFDKPGGHEDWPGDRRDEFRHDYPGSFMQHHDLKLILDTAVCFSECESPVKAEYFRDQFDRFQRAVETVPGVIGTFGTGYPFYAFQPNGTICDIPEVSRYVRSFIPALNLDKEREYGGWLCGACELANNLPDLKRYCKPCDSVDFKPRDIFRALPDLDFWVVVEDASEETLRAQEKAIEASAADATFFSSDTNIVQTLETTQYAMSTVLRGFKPGASLPVDMHVVTKATMMQCIQAVPQALCDNETVLISPRSLRKEWESPDMPYDFVKDFLFSLTPHTWNDPELLDVLERARHDVYPLIAHDPVGAVARRAEKEKRQLEATGVEWCLINRIGTWDETRNS